MEIILTFILGFTCGFVLYPIYMDKHDKDKNINHSLVVAKDNFDVLSKKFEELKEDRKTKTLIEQIEELKIQLAFEQNKTFWQKLFNK